MLDRLTLPLIALMAIAVIVFAMIWPQGYGARSPGPFGHIPIQQTPEMKAAMKREYDQAMRRQAEAAAAVAGASGPDLSAVPPASTVPDPAALAAQPPAVAPAAPEPLPPVKP